MNSTGKAFYLSLLALFLLSYPVIFLKLDSFHMRWWDESMFAVNTYEMMHNGKCFSLFFDGAPDNYNTKPPLTSWVQAVFVKLLGYNELAIRLPSALAALLCLIIVFGFLWKHYGPLWAWLSSLVLLTSWGFINFHTARTGESDSLLTLFLLLGNMYFITYMIRDKNSYIFWFLFFVTLAFAAKMFAALLFVPAYLTVLVSQKKLRRFILSREFLLGILLFLLVNIGLIYLRDLSTPGYIKEILFKDAGRVFNVVENHKEPFDFYLINLFSTRFSIWIALVLISFFFWKSPEKPEERKIVSILFWLCISYLLIISCSVTKLEWYDMPLYPCLAMLAGYTICQIVQKAQIANSKIIYCFTALLFAFPYYRMLDKAQGNTINSGEKILEANERYLFKREKENKDLNGLNVYFNAYKGSLLFYKYKLSEKGQQIKLTTICEFNTNDEVLVSSDSLKNVLLSQYLVHQIDQYDQAVVFKVERKL